MDEVNGRIEAVLYASEDSGYAVLRVATEDGGEVSVVGCIPLLRPVKRLPPRAPGRRILSTARSSVRNTRSGCCPEIRTASTRFSATAPSAASVRFLREPSWIDSETGRLR